MLQIISIMGLGSLKYVHDKTQFIAFSFMWKFLCGLGAGINSTSSFAIISRHYKNDRERTIGMMESSSGVGLLLGPFFGAILYEIGGYMLPFIVICKIYDLLTNS
jgi:MFS family permease